jgi:hypothetical protein
VGDELRPVGDERAARHARRGSGMPRASQVIAELMLVLAVLLIAGCSDLSGAAPVPTPQDFGGLAGQLALQGLTVGGVVSGDAGCDDHNLIPTAIGFDLSGLGVTTPIRARVFRFADDAAYQRRRADVDTCTAAWTTDPADVEFIDESPFVLVVQGPIPAAFKAALVRALPTSAGRGA